jgi:hypothetical protein
VLWKNFTLVFREKKQFLKELLFPIIVSLFIYISSDKNSAFGAIISFILPIYLPSSVNGFTRRLLVNFVEEKKEKHKEL